MRLPQKLLLVATALLAALALLYFVSTRDSVLIKSHFGIQLPANATVVVHKLNTFGFDGDVAWIISLDRANAIDLVPPDFEELKISEDWSSKYQEVLDGFRGTFPSEFSSFGRTRIFIGGPDGNSFIGISETAKRVILYRFWT